MAVDEWLMGLAAESGTPMMRVYGWSGDWVSFGYALSLSLARSQFPDPGLSYIRRWTGGGVVDHRNDWTYTVAVPPGDPLAALTAPERYSALHAALVAALQAEGIAVRLSDGSDVTGSDACFRNPVAHDVVDASGQKIAGAGQRRNRTGMLHQGSVITGKGEPAADSRAAALAQCLAANPEQVELSPPPETLDRLMKERYRHPDW
jgi:lipoate-protein ligase A